MESLTSAADRAGLRKLTDDELLARFRAFPPGSEQRAAACEILVDRHAKLVRSCARQYAGSPEPVEDLMQAGYVGLLKAINNYDPEAGSSLAGYAAPCVSGEIKRHFRDKRWQVHVQRSAQELMLSARAATDQLTHSLGRRPTDDEVAAHLGVSHADVQDARRADLAFSPWSLDAPSSDADDPVPLGEMLGAPDPDVELALDMQAVAAHWDELPEREQEILAMRFYGNLTQADIGARLGISQMHVSRLLARALDHLRGKLSEAGR
jgi:RNA polymerase sigma-B factor